MGTRFEKAVVSIVKETPAVQEAASEMATGASNQWLYMLCVSFFCVWNYDASAESGEVSLHKQRVNSPSDLQKPSPKSKFATEM